MNRIRVKLAFFISSIFAANVFVFNSISKSQEVLYIGAIPDQNPEKLNRLYKLLSKELSNNLNVPIRYKQVISYPAAVSSFRTGSLDLVWFGGLTGVQARLQKKGALVIAQREVDANFRSVFIANKKSNLPLIKTISDLRLLKGKRLTFGSESSTSGRLMPQFFLEKAGLSIKDFKGKQSGFSGSHDSTIRLVESGAYEVGALNELVWLSHIKNSKVNLNKVDVIWRTPTYPDYHWLAQGDIDDRFGKGFTLKLKKVILGLNRDNENQKKILDLFSAKRFISASNENYKSIESIGRKIGKIK